MSKIEERLVKIKTPLEERRPGITKLCERIRRDNPTWSDLRVASEAKMQYGGQDICSPSISTKG